MDIEKQTGASFATGKIPPFIKVKWESGEEDVHYAFLYDGMPEELRLRYAKELNETPENVEHGLSRLKKVIKHEKLESLSDDILLGVLRSAKFNFKKSESKLRKFIANRRKLVKEVAMMDMDVVKKVYDSTVFGFLPYRDKHGRSILYTINNGFDLEKFTVEDAVVVSLVALLFSLSFELSTSAGLIHILDAESPSMKILFQLFNIIPKFASNFFSFPLRVGKGEVLNEFPLIRWMYNVSRYLIPDKITKRISFIGPCENLIKTYHPDILPEEFGGNLGKLSNDFFKEEFFAFLADLKEEAKSKQN